MYDTVWWLHLPLFGGVAVLTGLFRGPRAAVAFTLFSSYLFPSWYNTYILGMPVNLRLAAAFIGLTVYLLHPKSNYDFRLTPIDILMLGLVSVHFLSDCVADGFSVGIPLRIYGEWFVPYICGRVAIQSWDDIRTLRWAATPVLILLGLFAIHEAVTRINWFESIYGPRPLDMMPRLAIRWNLRRAYGPTMHPIFLGMILLLLLPWTAFASLSNMLTLTRRGLLCWTTLIMCGCGVFVTGSRAPLLSLPILLGIGWFAAFPSQRRLLAVAGAMALLLCIWKKDDLTQIVESLGRAPRVAIGTDHEFSGSTARFHLLHAYGEALQQAGLLGYGTDAVSEFPVRVPTRVESVEEFRWLKYVDNQYILFVLRFGWLGLAFFCTAFVLTIISWRKDTGSDDLNLCWTAGLIMGSLIMATIQFTTVWLSHDVNHLLMFVFGSSSAMTLFRKDLISTDPYRSLRRFG